MKNKDFIEELNTYIANASLEDTELIKHIIQAVKEKHSGRYKSHLSALMQVKSTPLENGDCEFRVPIQPLIHNSLGMVHGGIIASLVDISMGSTVNQALPENSAAVTTEIKINYVKPGVGTELKCVASVIHKGKTLCVCEAKVYNNEEQLIAVGTGSFYLLKSVIVNK